MISRNNKMINLININQLKAEINLLVLRDTQKWTQGR